jgi:diguanylate cyclase (GGDEF)-like protein
MDCKQAQQWVVALLDNELTSEDLLLLDEHLEECPQCRSWQADLQGHTAALEQALAVEKRQAAAFAARVQERLRGEVKNLPGRETSVFWPRATVLVVDDEPDVRHVLELLLRNEFEVLTAGTAVEARAVFQSRPVDIVLSDLRMPGGDGVTLLEWAARTHPRTVRLLMTAFGDLQSSMDAINRGQVYQYFLKPWNANQPLLALRNAAEKCRLERDRDRLLDELRVLNRELQDRVVERTHRLEEANLMLLQRHREMARLALTDSLTGLNNRRAVERLARQEVRRHKRYRSPLAFALIDIDHFKQVNTDHLQTGGDEVLRSLARLLQTSLRDVDSLGRVGGEEFLLVAPETDEGGALHVGERIRAKVEDTPIRWDASEVRVTVSIGLATADADTPADYQTLYGLASEAMKRAKSGGRNRVELLRMGRPDA